MPVVPFVHAFARPPGLRIGMLGTYPPQLCGLATFAAALEAQFVRAGHDVTIIAVNGGAASAATPPRPYDQLLPADAESIRTTAQTLSRCDVAIVQHEYGIYGGADGEDVLDVLRLTDCPTIVVLHTVPATPSPHQRSVLEAVCELATRVVVMTEAAHLRLTRGYVVDAVKLGIIPHGAWSASADPPVDHTAGPARLELLTWGLIGPGKGIEHMIAAMARLGDLAPRVRYTVAGVTHPNVLARDGDRYRESLIALASARGVAHSVRFDDTYRDVTGLRCLAASASIVVLPYDSQDQVTSGVLVDAIAAGRPVIATAFPHAVELLRDGAGLLVPHGDPGALAAAVRAASRPGVLSAMTARACQLAPTLAWSAVAAQYLALCDTFEPAATSVAAAR